MSARRNGARVALAIYIACMGIPFANVAHASAQEPSAPRKLPTKPVPLQRRDLSIPTALPGIMPRRLNTGAPAQKVRMPEPGPPRPYVTPPAPSRAPSRATTTRAPARTGTAYGNLKTIADMKTKLGEECIPFPPKKEISFDFEGEIQELVEAISVITCRNFILTNKIRSQKFKISSPVPVFARDAWRVFLAALEANDFTVVPSGKYWKIIQANDATRSPVPFYDEGRSLRRSGMTFPTDEQMVTKIYRTKYGGNINNIVNYLNIFKSNRGQIHPFQGSNLVIMTDFASTLERLEHILEELDQPDVLEKIHIVPVEYASASEIAEKLTQIFEPKNAQARRAAGASEPPKLAKPIKAEAQPKAAAKKEGSDSPGSVSKILADDRTNKIIIIASDSTFRQIVALLRQLDVPEDITDGQIHVLRLKHADAEELASTLSSLAQGQTGRAAGNRRGQAAQAGAKQAAALFEGEVKVTSDKATNSLVITASKSDLSSLRRVIDSLDVPRFQVFVEAAILEVSTTKDRDLGVGWHAGVPVTLDGETSPLIFANTPSTELSSIANTVNPLGLASLLGLATALRGPTLEGTEDLVTGGIPSLGVVLQALQSSNDVNVVSTPHLLTMDNEEAEIQVNEKRPFPSGLTLGGLGGLASSVASSAAGSAASSALGNLSGLGLGSVSFNREDIGLTLKLKPQINDEDYVRLEIDQELSDVAGTDQVTGQVITSKRSAKTTVVVRSQDSVIIGGLVRDRETRSESKLPLLGDIPLIGWLFKSQGKTVEKVNLVLVITPYIIRGPKDFREIYERKMKERKEFVDLFYGQTEEYRAKIDWSQKVGPIAAYRQTMRKEMLRAENDGPGLPGQVIIRPSRNDEDDEGIPAPASSYGDDEGVPEPVTEPPPGSGSFEAPMVEEPPPGDTPPIESDPSGPPEE